jgi:prevent-host-death family protein
MPILTLYRTRLPYCRAANTPWEAGFKTKLRIVALRNTNEISDICHAKKEPVFITKNGYGDLVVMSIETYEAMLEERELDAVSPKPRPNIRLTDNCSTQEKLSPH